jgi:outer membrane protein OmpA-like peptidoglycan-associated protein
MKKFYFIKKHALYIVCAAAILQAGCSFDSSAATPAIVMNAKNVSSVTDQPRAVTPFQSVLAAEYRALAQKKRNTFELSDYSHFRKKATAAGRGEKVKIDPPDSRELRPDDAARLSTARKRLQNLPREVYTAFPRDAARAQVAFDCWFEEMADGHEPSQCESRLNDLLAQMECLGGCEEGAEGDIVKTYEVSFDLNSKELNPSAKAVIVQAAAAIQDRPGVSVLVSGHTDRSGSAAYNRRLAKRRADAVAAMLRERGVSGDLIRVEALGERAQAVVTDDDVDLEGNRRVVISIME